MAPEQPQREEPLSRHEAPSPLQHAAPHDTWLPPHEQRPEALLKEEFEGHSVASLAQQLPVASSRNPDGHSAVSAAAQAAQEPLEQKDEPLGQQDELASDASEQ